MGWRAMSYTIPIVHHRYSKDDICPDRNTVGPKMKRSTEKDKDVSRVNKLSREYQMTKAPRMRLDSCTG